MPNTSITDALKEVYSMAPNDRVTLNTLQLSHESLEESIYMVQDRREWNLTLEDDSIQTFEPVPFRFTPPKVETKGFRELRLAIDNIGTTTDGRVTDFIDQISDFSTPVEVTFRPYLSDDPTTIQMDPALLLYLTDIQTNAFEVVGRATFSNFMNMKYPTEYYDGQAYPGLVS